MKPDKHVELAERCDDFTRRIYSIVDNNELSIGGKQVALALLVTMNVDLFDKAAAALRASQGKVR